MKRDHGMKLLSEVRDLQIVDCDGKNCGICDDILFEGAPGDALRVSALIVGPGAYKTRLPHWAFSLVKWIAGDHAVRVPWDKVDKVTARIYLTERGESVGLRQVEDRFIKRMKKVPTS